MENSSTSESTENHPSKPEWTALKVAHIATGNLQRDRELAKKAKKEGYIVLLSGSLKDSDPVFHQLTSYTATPARSGLPTKDSTASSPQPGLFTKAISKVNRVIFRDRSRTEITVNILSAIALMIVGHLLLSFFTYDRIVHGLNALLLEEDFFYFLLGGFVAQMIDGALGMAYGVTATTFLLTLGIPPSVASASVHTSEIFTSGVSGYMHLKFGNVNSKLFKNLLFPGIVGAILGAYVLTSLEQYIYIIKPVVAFYTLILGILIIRKALNKVIKKRPVKHVGWLALAGGTMDAVGGGGWGPIVSTTLIARGRHPKYTIGSVNLTEFFVSLASSVTFISLIGFSHWQVIVGLILGGTVAAPIAASLSRRLPVKTMMILVGIVVIIVSLRIIYMVASSYWF